MLCLLLKMATFKESACAEEFIASDIFFKTTVLKSNWNTFLQEEKHIESRIAFMLLCPSFP